MKTQFPDQVQMCKSLFIILIFSYILNLNDALLPKSSLFSKSVKSNIKSNTKLNANDDSDILIRALKGEKVERTPVWLMRQVDFRKKKR